MNDEVSYEIRISRKSGASYPLPHEESGSVDTLDEAMRQAEAAVKEPNVNFVVLTLVTRIELKVWQIAKGVEV